MRMNVHTLTKTVPHDIQIVSSSLTKGNDGDER